MIRFDDRLQIIDETLDEISDEIFWSLMIRFLIESLFSIWKKKSWCYHLKRYYVKFMSDDVLLFYLLSDCSANIHESRFERQKLRSPRAHLLEITTNGATMASCASKLSYQVVLNVSLSKNVSTSQKVLIFRPDNHVKCRSFCVILAGIESAWSA